LTAITSRAPSARAADRTIAPELDLACFDALADDPEARLTKHNAGEVTHTSKYKPWRIKTYVAFSDEKRAFAFEKYLKSGSGRAFANKRL